MVSIMASIMEHMVLKMAIKGRPDDERRDDEAREGRDPQARAADELRNRQVGKRRADDQKRARRGEGTERLGGITDDGHAVHVQKREDDSDRAGDVRRGEEGLKPHLHLCAAAGVLRDEPDAHREHEEVERQVEDRAVNQRRWPEDG